MSFLNAQGQITSKALMIAAHAEAKKMKSWGMKASYSELFAKALRTAWMQAKAEHSCHPANQGKVKMVEVHSYGGPSHSLSR